MICLVYIWRLNSLFEHVDFPMQNSIPVLGYPQKQVWKQLSLFYPFFGLHTTSEVCSILHVCQFKRVQVSSMESRGLSVPLEWYSITRIDMSKTWWISKLCKKNLQVLFKNLPLISMTWHGRFQRISHARTQRRPAQCWAKTKGLTRCSCGHDVMSMEMFIDWMKSDMFFFLWANYP